jgi:hypothetical protein
VRYEATMNPAMAGLTPVSDLHFEEVQPVGGEATLRDWQYVHNLIIPTDPLSATRRRRQ